ncbi:alpha/beta hydrolase [Dyella sp. GSA-30]|nr:alpha/beta hydrolase [Dyella sp. GSA-30]
MVSGAMRAQAMPWQAVVMVCMVLLLVACAPVKPSPSVSAPQHEAVDWLAQARSWATDASHQKRPEFAQRAWLRCAAAGYRALANDAGQAREALHWYSLCTTRLVDDVFDRDADGWTSRNLSFGDDTISLVIDAMPASLHGPLQLVPADSVTIPESFGVRHTVPGVGVPLVVAAQRCSDKPLCKLYPPEGVSRAATAWIDVDAQDRPRLHITDPEHAPDIVIGSTTYPLARDTTAPYAYLFDQSKLKRLAVWNLIGGKEIGLRQGLYLLEDYDPHKTPIVMIHGLGASPLIWGKLTNRVLGTPELHARYQIWHVVYQTDAPLLVSRLRVQQFLDQGWKLLDPSGADPARQQMVLVGHSMGGVIARLLSADSGDLLWRTAFTVSPEKIKASADDLDMLKRLFFFHPYPGVTQAIFLAAPHLGSPVSQRLLGRIAVLVLNPHGPELDALRRIAKNDPTAVQSNLLAVYQSAGLSSVSTMRDNQPVSHASQSLMPAPGIRYYTIAGDLPGASVRGDGIVPLSSAVIPGAVSTTIVAWGHKLYNNPEAIDKVIGILNEKPVDRENPPRDALSQQKP